MAEKQPEKSLPERLQGKPFDSVTKVLVALRPEDWVKGLGLTGSPAEVWDADLATVTTEADRVIYVSGSQPYLLHIEFQAGRDPSIIIRMLRYHVLLRTRYNLPIRSVVILLRPEADLPELTGTLEWNSVGLPDTGVSEPALTFRYDILRVWTKSAAEFLNGPLGLVPLAPLTKKRGATYLRSYSLWRSVSPARPPRTKTGSYWQRPPSYWDYVINRHKSGTC